MPLGPQMAGILGAAGTVAGGYDVDAQAYFDQLVTDGASPSDAQKTAISVYFTNLKADSNFTPIKAMYLPIWQAAAPNAINAVNPGTYDLTFAGTVTHDGGDYIYGDGSTGYATTGFHGAGSSNDKFFEIGSASAGANVLDNPSGNSKCAWGWYNFFLLVPRWHSTAAGIYWVTTTSAFPTTDGTKNGLWTSNSVTPGGSDTSKGQLWRNGSSLGTTAASSGAALGGGLYNAVPLMLMAKVYFNGNSYSESTMQFNFWFFGTEISDIDEFNTDTATFLAAI